MPSFDPVNAVVRALEVLRVLNALGVATVAELQKQTGLHRATVVRMVETLEQSGYVSRLAGSTRFAPTGRVLQLSNGYHAHEQVKRAAEPVLARLRGRLGWPSAVAIPDGTQMMIACAGEAFNGLMLNRHQGTRAPMLVSTLGRAYIAHCGDEERARIVNLLKASTDPFDRSARNTASLNRLLRSIRNAGYATADSAYSHAMYSGDVTGFAIPIRVGSKVVATISIVFFATTMTLEHAVAALLPALQAAALEIANVLTDESATAMAFA